MRVGEGRVRSRGPSRRSPRSAWSSGLGEEPTEEELEEARVSALPVIAVVLRPPLCRREPLVERVHVARGVRARAGPLGRGTRRRGPGRAHRRRPVRPTPRRTTARRARPSVSVASSTASAVGGELQIAVRGRAGRPVGSTAAPAVERHHPVVAGEVRHLELPVAASGRSTTSAAARSSARPRRTPPSRASPVALGVAGGTGSIALITALVPSRRRPSAPRRRGSVHRCGAGWPGSASGGGRTPAAATPRADERVDDERGRLGRRERAEAAEPVGRLRGDVGEQLVPAPHHLPGGGADLGRRPPGGDHLLQDPDVARLEVVLQEVARPLVAPPQRARPRRTSRSGGRGGARSRLRAGRAPCRPWSRSGSGPGTAARRPPGPPCVSRARRSRRRGAGCGPRRG